MNFTSEALRCGMCFCSVCCFVLLHSRSSQIKSSVSRRIHFAFTGPRHLYSTAWHSWFCTTIQLSGSCSFWAEYTCEKSFFCLCWNDSLVLVMATVIQQTRHRISHIALTGLLHRIAGKAATLRAISIVCWGAPCICCAYGGFGMVTVTMCRSKRKS